MKMYHPNLDVAVEVDEDRVDSHAAQGWRKSRPKRFTKKSDDAPKGDDA